MPRPDRAAAPHAIRARQFPRDDRSSCSGCCPRSLLHLSSCLPLYHPSRRRIKRPCDCRRKRPFTPLEPFAVEAGAADPILDGCAAGLHRTLGHPHPRAADPEPLRADGRPLAHGLSRLGPLRQRPSLGRRLSLRRRPLVGSVQPERAQGRLPDPRPAHVPEHHRHEPVASSSPAGADAARRRSRATANPFAPEFFGDPDQFFYTHFFKFSVEPVPRRRGVQAGRLADQAHADLQRQLPRRGGAGRREPRRAARARPAAAATSPWRNGSSRRSWPTSRPTTTSSRCGPARSSSSATSAASSSATPTAPCGCSARGWPIATSST